MHAVSATYECSAVPREACSPEGEAAKRCGALEKRTARLSDEGVPIFSEQRFASYRK